MSVKKLRIGIVAGEASGDVLAAGMIRQIKLQYPDAIIEGIAGPNMQDAGCRSLFEMEELSVMGLVEVLSRIRRLMFIRKYLKQYFSKNRPDVFIGVDAPDFNLNLESFLKKQGIKTVHYVSPTVWAWREKRIFGIAQATNLVLSIFPFEKAIYDKYGFPCRYVGHTMADDIALHPDKDLARSELNIGDISDGSKVLAMLPGSRGSEVSMLLDIFLQAGALLNHQLSGLTVLIPAASEIRKRQIEAIINNFKLLNNDLEGLTLHVLDGQARNAMIAADAVLLASGTASLEAMLCKRPMVVAYRLKWFTHKLMQRLYKADYFALPNLLAKRKIVPELLQQQVNPQTLMEHLKPLLCNDSEQVTDTFVHLHEQLRQGADKQSAEAVLELIDAAK